MLQEGSSESITLATLVTACGIAVADAGLEMFGLVVGAGSESTFVSYMPELNQVTGLLSINSPDISMDEDIKNVINKAKSIYPTIYDFFTEKSDAIQK